VSCILRLMDNVVMGPTSFDGLYVKAYDPTYVDPAGYDGGILEVTGDPREAMRFPDVKAALEKWRQAYGMREDGRPNRPMTMWSVEIETVPEELMSSV